jgi:hypothetical protein
MVPPPTTTEWSKTEAPLETASIGLFSNSFLAGISLPESLQTSIGQLFIKDQQGNYYSMKEVSSHRMLQDTLNPDSKPWTEPQPTYALEDHTHSELAD